MHCAQEPLLKNENYSRRVLVAAAPMQQEDKAGNRRRRTQCSAYTFTHTFHSLTRFYIGCGKKVNDIICVSATHEVGLLYFEKFKMYSTKLMVRNSNGWVDKK